jgi:hypothetical protein
MPTKLTTIGGHAFGDPTRGLDLDIPVRTHCLIILGEYLAKNRVHNTEHHGVGHGLDQQGLAWGEGQNDTGGEEDEQNDGDNDVEIHVCIKALKNISSQKYIHVNGEKFQHLSPPSNSDKSATLGSSHSCAIGVLENPKY